MTPDPRRIEDQLRDRLVPDRDLAYEAARAASATRCRTEQFVLGAPKPRGARRRRPRGPVAFAVVAAAIAAVVAVAAALAPDRARPGTAPFVPASASAAQALHGAGASLREGGTSTAGSGSVWRSVTRTYHEGALVSVRESWFDTARSANLFAAWGRVGPGTPHGGARDVVLVDRLRADGTRAIRTAERPRGSDEWRLPRTMDPMNAVDIPAGDGTRQGALSFAVRDWLAALGTDPSDAGVRRATRAFMRATSDQFQLPVLPSGAELDGSGGRGFVLHEEQYEEIRHVEQVRAAMYLLTTAQASGEQTAAVYDLLGGFDSLERLGDVTIDGRRAYRIRYDGRDQDYAGFTQQVAVIDAGSGRLVRTETLDRSAWSIVEPATRVAAVGDDSRLCAESLVDCGIVAGTGAIEQQAATFVRNERVRYAAYRENRAHGRDLCRDMTASGECLPRTPAEARELARIERETRGRSPLAFDNGTASLRDDDAFVLAVRLSPADSPSGIYAPGGTCTRDWRILTTCAG